MSVDPEIIRKALALTREQRAEFARRLLLSLEDLPSDPGAEDAWAAEIERRLARLPEAGGVPVGSDWRAAIERIRRGLR